jgi:cell division septation protein DedD
MEYDNLGPKNFKKHTRDEEVFFEDKNTYGEEERWWWIFQNPLGVIIMIAVAIVLIIGLWFIFHSPSKPSDNQHGVMIVKSENTAYKEEAADSATPSVENQDKEVYKRLGQQHTEEQTTSESIAVEEEKPLEAHEFPETTAKAEEKKSLDQPNALRKITENVGVKMPAPALNEEFIAEKKSEPTPVKENTESEAALKPVIKTSQDKIKNPKGLNDGIYTLRIASFRKMETAERELQRVFDTLGAALKDVGRLVKRIESDSGVFYIVTIGAFSTLAKAKQLAKLLKEKNFNAVIQKVSG